MGILQKNIFMAYLYKKEKNDQIKELKKIKLKSYGSGEIQTADLFITRRAP